MNDLEALKRGLDSLDQPKVAGPESPTTDDFATAVELVEAIGPVESRHIAIYMAAHVICVARMSGLVQGLKECR